MTVIPTAHYDRQALVDGLRAVGIREGDIVFSHIGMGMLGFPEGPRTMEHAAELLESAFREVLGETGTWLVPTYTYSYCGNEVYDPEVTPSAVGDFTNWFRTRPGVIRSIDPIFSVAGIGPRAAEILEDLPRECFGDDCVYERLCRVGAKTCNVGVGFRYATFVHYAEQMHQVPYRFLKLFSGWSRINGKLERQAWVYNVRIYAFNHYGGLARLEHQALEDGCLQSTVVGRGAITSIDCTDLLRLCSENIEKDPWYLATRVIEDLVGAEEQRVGGKEYPVELPPDATMSQMVDVLWALPRDIVSAGYDAALRALATQVPMTIHEYPSGSPCWTWIVPERWTCHEAYLETMDGRRLFSYADNPLHVVSYSLPFDGEVTREELDRHLHVHPTLPGAIPFVYKYYERDWGLCCSRELKEQLTEERYRVRIRTDFSYSTLKVGEVVIPGESEESIYLCAHLCHGAMVNDDLTGVVVGIDVMRQLLQRERRRYTYRLLIVPETVGSVAFLSRNEALFPLMKGGLFLEMLALDLPHSLQLSFDGNTEVDRCFRAAFVENAPDGWVAAFDAGNVVNDERQFNAPGVRVPMLSLLRVQPRGHAEWPFREYHSSYDNPELVSQERLEQTRSLVLKMIDTLERNVVPINRYKGEVFLSRYGISPDWSADPDGALTLFETMYRIDGQRSILQIAEELNAPFSVVAGVVDLFRKRGLVA